MHNRTRALWLAAAGALTASVAATATPMHERPEVNRFIDEMATRHGMVKPALVDVFRQTEHRQEIIDAISRPAESKPWHSYRPIFVTDSRAREGAEFLALHRDILTSAERRFGVPKEIITAIIGVETRYGRHRGKHRVMDSLTTLAFDYPPRAKFFRSELEQFLLLSREEGIDPLSMTGSYAGAMGQPQFISSSFRAYAIDFDGDGKRDLWDTIADVAGSVANYLSVHGWKPGEPVAAPARVTGAGHAPLLDGGVKPSHSTADFARHGVRVETVPHKNAKGALLALDGEDGKEYWVGWNNFYVITRYNHSPLYAMAVYQLSEEIRKLDSESLATTDSGNE